MTSFMDILWLCIGVWYIVPHVTGCGGVFHDRNGIIQSPSFPDDYPNNAECLWELRSDEGYHIGLTFTTNFQIEQSDNCENDFLEIWDFRNGNWLSLGKKCGRDLPEAINSTSNKIKIFFRSNERIAGKEFRVQWEWKCGGSFIADQTERFIVSPGYPTFYKKSMNCQYNISGNSSKEHVNIKFYDIELEGTGSNCTHDNLTVSTIMPGYRPSHKQVFCGKRTPPNIRLINTVHMLFQTDAWVQKSRFKFSYQLDNCGGTITSPTAIELPPMNIPRIPGLYYAYVDCVWNVTAPFNKSIVVRFQKFSFEFRRNCVFDHVEVYEGYRRIKENRLVNLCGDLNKNLPVVKTKNNSALITLLVDRSANHDGFKAEVYFADACGETLDIQSNATHTLLPPLLPDLDCEWLIKAPVGNYIKLVVKRVNLNDTCGVSNHTHHNCNCGYLEIKDGYPGGGERIKKFCGTNEDDLNMILTSTGNIAGVRLYTRGTPLSNRGAFNILYKLEPSPCGSVYLNASKDVQTLTSPGYPNKYPSNLKCDWVLWGRVTVRFVDFDLNEENNQQILANNVCGEDKLEVVDEKDTNILANAPGENFFASGNNRKTSDFGGYMLMTGAHQYCGKTEKPLDYFENINDLVIKFSSGNQDRNRGRGFKLEFRAGDIGCDKNFTETQGRIVNPWKTDCYQLITVPKNYTISVFFQDFYIDHPVNCYCGLEIRDGADESANLLQKVCETALPNPVFSTTNKLWIHAWKDKRKCWASKYDLVYTSSDQGRGCGGTLFNYKGVFTSPMYPMGYKNSTPCEWDVRVPTGMRVVIKFTVFHIQGDCEQNYLKVTTYEKNDGNEHKFCQNDNPAELYSSSHLLVRYQSSLDNGGAGWSARFEAVAK